MPRSADDFETMRDESRTRLLQSALRLFARHGYAHTTVRMLAEDAGMSQGLLYNYFAGKEALLRAIFERSTQDVADSFARAFAAPTPDGELAALVRSAMDIVREHQDFWRLTYQLRMQPEVLASLGDDVRLNSAEIVARMERLLQNPVSSGPGSEGSDGGASRQGSSAAAARALFASIDGAAQHYVIDPGHYPLDEVAEEIIERFS